jgi:hypothetical protein
VQPTITEHNGRIVKLMGDGLRPTHKASYGGELG